VIRRHPPTEQHTYRLFLQKGGAPTSRFAWCDVLASDKVSAVLKVGELFGASWVIYTNPITVPHVGYQLNGTHPMRLLGNGVWQGLPIE